MTKTGMVQNAEGLVDGAGCSQELVASQLADFSKSIAISRKLAVSEPDLTKRSPAFLRDAVRRDLIMTR